jgi:hypothetical protein
MVDAAAWDLCCHLSFGVSTDETVRLYVELDATPAGDLNGDTRVYPCTTISTACYLD